MFCKNCGKEIEEGVNFCKNCGVAVGPSPMLKEEFKSEKLLEKEQIPTKISRPLHIMRRIFILIVVFGLILIGMVAIFLYVAGINQTSKNDIYSAVNGFQTKISEVVANKILLDSVANKKSDQAKEMVVTLNKQYLETTVQSEDFSAFIQMKDYQAAVTDWLKIINDSTQELNQWSKIAKQPRDFLITVNDQEAELLLKNSVNIILDLKKTGDEAFKNKDKQAMAMVSAKLLIQKHWLEGLSYSKNISVSNLFINRTLAYSGGARSICFTAANGKPLCSKEVSGFLSAVHQASVDYIAGKLQIQTKWDDLWKNNPEIAAELQAPRKEISAPTNQQPLMFRFIEDKLKSIITPKPPIGNLTPASDILGFSLKGTWRSSLRGKGLQVYGKIASGPGTTKIYEDGDIELIIESVAGNTAYGKIRYFNMCSYGEVTVPGVSAIAVPKQCMPDSGFSPVKIRVSGSNLDFGTVSANGANFSMQGSYTSSIMSGTMTTNIPPYGVIKGEFHLSRPL